MFNEIGLRVDGLAGCDNPPPMAVSWSHFVIRIIVVIKRATCTSPPFLALYYLIHEGCKVHCIGYDYGQIHRSELRCAKGHCESLGVEFTQIDLLERRLFKTSSITGGDGSDIVPNRNAIFLHIAASLAMSAKADCVTIGCNREDRERFPDCSPQFIAAMNQTLKTADVPVEICAPFIDMTKREIVELGRKIKAPLEDSVSCYKGVGCGECDACKKRKAALE